jgi:hypothetical protein
VVDSTELQVDSVFLDRPVRPENTDSDTTNSSVWPEKFVNSIPSDGVDWSSERNGPLKNPLAGNRVVVVLGPEISWEEVSEVTV